jgi:hypothetical protein
LTTTAGEKTFHRRFLLSGRPTVFYRSEQNQRRDAGQVGVCEAGKARAIMKATEKGAVISAVHADGHARIPMMSELNNGERLAVTPGMKVGVKIAAFGLDGGFICVNNRHGKAGVILSNVGVGGTVIVQDPQGNIIDHRPGLPEE